MAHQARWLRLELGYESPTPDTCTTKPHMQTVFERYFRPATCRRWASAGRTAIQQAPTPASDNWVAEVLTTELNKALQATRKGDRIRIDEGNPLRFLAAQSGRRASTLRTGQPGTRCQLSGDHWINTRSYLLIDQGTDTMWLEDEAPAGACVYATLTWLCHAVGRSAAAAAADGS